MHCHKTETKLSITQVTEETYQISICWIDGLKARFLFRNAVFPEGSLSLFDIYCPPQLDG